MFGEAVALFVTETKPDFIKDHHEPGFRDGLLILFSASEKTLSHTPYHLSDGTVKCPTRF